MTEWLFTECTQWAQSLSGSRDVAVNRMDAVLGHTVEVLKQGIHRTSTLSAWWSHQKGSTGYSGPGESVKTSTQVIDATHLGQWRKCYNGVEVGQPGLKLLLGHWIPLELQQVTSPISSFPCRDWEWHDLTLRTMVGGRILMFPLTSPHAVSSPPLDCVEWTRDLLLTNIIW